VSRWARIALVALIAWMAVVVFWATRPWSDTQPLKVPVGTKPAFTTYHCSAVFSASTPGVHEGVAATFPTTRMPCAERNHRREVTYLDAGLGVVAIASVIVVGRRRRDAADAERDADADGPGPDAGHASPDAGPRATTAPEA
jgi:hypothetical protein